MCILRALVFLFLTQAVLAEQPTPILPDAKLTPGDTFDVTAEDVCVPGYAKKVRSVPAWLKRQAYAEYGITQYETGDYEVDHLIPLSLGGSNSIRNLWPQSTKTLEVHRATPASSRVTSEEKVRPDSILSTVKVFIFSYFIHFVVALAYAKLATQERQGRPRHREVP